MQERRHPRHGNPCRLWSFLEIQNRAFWGQNRNDPRAYGIIRKSTSGTNITSAQRTWIKTFPSQNLKVVLRGPVRPRSIAPELFESN